MQEVLDQITDDLDQKEIVHCVMCTVNARFEVISAQPYAICGAPNNRVKLGTIVQEDPPANPCKECLFKVKGV